MTDLLAFALAMGIGWLTIRLLAPAGGLAPRWAADLYESALGVGAGAGLTGGLYFVMVVTGVANRWAVLGVELLLGAGLGFLYVRRPRATASVQSSNRRWRWNTILAGLLALTLLLTVIAQVNLSRAQPYGEWDAFAIWNIRAQYFAGPSDAWQNAVSPLVPEMHPDYPPLLSAFIGRCWKIGGSPGSPPAPIATGLAFFWGAMALLVASLALLRATSAGLLACFVLLATRSHFELSVWQYADIPISFYFLAALSLLLIWAGGNANRNGIWLSVGAFASFASLVKDEGIPFLLFVLGCGVALAWKYGGRSGVVARAKWMLVGAAPGIVLLAIFKFALAPSIGPLRGQTMAQTFEKLVDPERYVLVMSGAISQIVGLGNGLAHPLVLLAILVVALRFSVDPKLRPAIIGTASVVGLTIVTYGLIYIVNPDDLTWRIETTINRLCTHVWPSLLLLVFLVLNPPVDPVPAEDDVREPERSVTPKRKKKGRRRSSR